jgi:hypothetical protein
MTYTNYVQYLTNANARLYTDGEFLDGADGTGGLAKNSGSGFCVSGTVMPTGSSKLSNGISNISHIGAWDMVTGSSYYIEIGKGQGGNCASNPASRCLAGYYDHSSGDNCRPAARHNYSYNDSNASADLVGRGVSLNKTN